MKTLWCVIALSAFALGVNACDFCRSNINDPETGGASGITAGGLRKLVEGLSVKRAIDGLPNPNTNEPRPSPTEIDESPADKAMREIERGPSKARHWLSTTSFEYTNWKRVQPEHGLAINSTPTGHIHGLIDEWFVTESISYAVTDDLSVGVSQNYRHLRQINVEDPANLGRHEYLDGLGDLRFDVKYRFLRQSECVPADVAVFAEIKPPTGETRERNHELELFDAENQAGTGGWEGTLGMSASKRWGTWGASGSFSYTRKGEGSQNFKAGDVFRTTLGFGKLLPCEPCGWKFYANFGLQDVAEIRGREDGHVDRNHGGQTLYTIPGIAARPNDRLILSFSAPIPVYQDLVGTHQKQSYSLTFAVGVRF